MHMPRHSHSHTMHHAGGIDAGQQAVAALLGAAGLQRTSSAASSMNPPARFFFLPLSLAFSLTFVSLSFLRCRPTSSSSSSLTSCSHRESCRQQNVDGASCCCRRQQAGVLPGAPTCLRCAPDSIATISWQPGGAHGSAATRTVGRIARQHARSSARLAGRTCKT